MVELKAKPADYVLLSFGFYFASKSLYSLIKDNNRSHIPLFSTNLTIPCILLIVMNVLGIFYSGPIFWIEIKIIYIILGLLIYWSLLFVTRKSIQLRRALTLLAIFNICGFIVSAVLMHNIPLLDLVFQVLFPIIIDHAILSYAFLLLTKYKSQKKIKSRFKSTLLSFVALALIRIAILILQLFYSSGYNIMVTDYVLLESIMAFLVTLYSSHLLRVLRTIAKVLSADEMLRRSLAKEGIGSKASNTETQKREPELKGKSSDSSDNLPSKYKNSQKKEATAAVEVSGNKKQTEREKLREKEVLESYRNRAQLVKESPDLAPKNDSFKSPIKRKPDSEPLAFTVDAKKYSVDPKSIPAYKTPKNLLEMNKNSSTPSTDDETPEPRPLQPKNLKMLQSNLETKQPSIGALKDFRENRYADAENNAKSINAAATTEVSGKDYTSTKLAKKEPKISNFDRYLRDSEAVEDPKMSQSPVVSRKNAKNNSNEDSSASSDISVLRSKTIPNPSPLKQQVSLSDKFDSQDYISKKRASESAIKDAKANIKSNEIKQKELQKTVKPNTLENDSAVKNRDNSNGKQKDTQGTRDGTDFEGSTKDKDSLKTHTEHSGDRKLDGEELSDINKDLNNLTVSVIKKEPGAVKVVSRSASRDSRDLTKQPLKVVKKLEPKKSIQRNAPKLLYNSDSIDNDAARLKLDQMTSLKILPAETLTLKQSTENLAPVVAPVLPITQPPPRIAVARKTRIVANVDSELKPKVVTPKVTADKPKPAKIEIIYPPESNKPAEHAKPKPSPSKVELIKTDGSKLDYNKISATDATTIHIFSPSNPFNPNFNPSPTNPFTPANKKDLKISTVQSSVFSKLKASLSDSSIDSLKDALNEFDADRKTNDKVNARLVNYSDQSWPTSPVDKQSGLKNKSAIQESKIKRELSQEKRTSHQQMQGRNGSQERRASQERLQESRKSSQDRSVMLERGQSQDKKFNRQNSSTSSPDYSDYSMTKTRSSSLGEHSPKSAGLPSGGVIIMGRRTNSGENDLPLVRQKSNKNAPVGNDLKRLSVVKDSDEEYHTLRKKK
eukprot:NODE_7_length_48057_cov_0.322240.p2 type:complete len:1064 gc:universal NODE_7_length_48057_cov_0.322240:36068-32877(-)